MNSLRQSARRIHVLSRTAKHRRAIQPGSQLILRNLATHGAGIGANLTSQTRPVTRVEKIILDTIKVVSVVLAIAVLSDSMARVEGKWPRLLLGIHVPVSRPSDGGILHETAT